MPAIVGRMVHADAVERALRVLLAAPAAEVARRHGLAAERIHLMPAGILVLETASRRGSAARSASAAAACAKVSSSSWAVLFTRAGQG